ncbi:MAG: peptidase domain-containing protein [Methanoregula sp.]|jgi:hypothetical protein
MKVHWIALLILIGAAVSIPTVSAQIIEEKDGYVVSTVNGTLLTPEVSLLSLPSITQGQTDVYSTYVPSGKTAFSSTLTWGSPSNSLSLTINAPDSQFGPYYDSSDGITDGHIGLMITRTGGLTQGTWRSYVNGYRVTGSQAYSYTVMES